MELRFAEADDVAEVVAVTQPEACEIDALGWYGCTLRLEVVEPFKGTFSAGDKLQIRKSFRWSTPQRPIPQLDLAKHMVVYLQRYSTESSESRLLSCSECMRLLDHRDDLPVAPAELRSCLRFLADHPAPIASDAPANPSLQRTPLSS